MKKTVKVREMILGEGLPKVCIPVTAMNKKELMEQLDKILENPFDLIEWRVDFYQETSNPEEILEALRILREKLQEKPILFTFRTKEEGGERSISMEEYEQLCLMAARSGMADLIDIELNRGEERLERMCKLVQEAGCKVVASYHDFHMTPEKDEIIRILCKMQKLGADVTKAALMPQKERDVMVVLDASLDMKENYADRPYITMSMSRLGSVSRLAGGLTGSALTFATAGRASAPGQLEAMALSRLLPNL